MIAPSALEGAPVQGGDLIHSILGSQCPHRHKDVRTYATPSFLVEAHGSVLVCIIEIRLVHTKEIRHSENAHSLLSGFFSVCEPQLYIGHSEAESHKPMTRGGFHELDMR